MARMMSSGVVLIFLGCLAAALGVWAGFNETRTLSCDITNPCPTATYYQIVLLVPLAPSSFVLIGGGVLLTLMGTVFTAVGHSKRTIFQEQVLFVARGDAQA
jgi:hypothetical protein